MPMFRHLLSECLLLLLYLIFHSLNRIPLEWIFIDHYDWLLLCEAGLGLLVVTEFRYLNEVLLTLVIELSPYLTGSLLKHLDNGL